VRLKRKRLVGWKARWGQLAANQVLEPEIAYLVNLDATNEAGPPP